ncbi:hypothetical protein niasHT_038187 [Heterodera trifolii]|uniref:Secreted protein n=1 Tax=Heterodera trifolii TaxID=157864 RepID=A0ABD2J2A1_9BILA
MRFKVNNKFVLFALASFALHSARLCQSRFDFHLLFPPISARRPPRGYRWPSGVQMGCTQRRAMSPESAQMRVGKGIFDGALKTQMCQFMVLHFFKAFLNATTSVGFIVVARWYCRVVPFELKRADTVGTAYISTIGAYGKGTDWARCTAMGRRGKGSIWREWRQSGRNVLVFRAYDDDMGGKDILCRFSQITNFSALFALRH